MVLSLARVMSLVEDWVFMGTPKSVAGMVDGDDDGLVWLNVAIAFPIQPIFTINSVVVFYGDRSPNDA